MRRLPTLIFIMGCMGTTMWSMSPQEIADRYTNLLESYPPSTLVRACLESRQEDVINMINTSNINEQEPRFGKVSCLYEFSEPALSQSATPPAGITAPILKVRQRISGFTPLHYSITNQMYPLFAKLLSHDKLNPNLQDIYGNTPLHYAVNLMVPIFVYDLAQHYQCNPYIQNNKGLTPLAIAYELKDMTTDHKKTDDLRIIINILNTAMDKTTVIDNPFVSEDNIQLEGLPPQNAA